METVAPILDVVNNCPYLTLTSVILGCAALVRLARWRSRSHLPPGPKGYPIVGNLFDLPASHIWEQFGAWGRQYGDVTYIKVLGRGTIILNSQKAAVDLLDKRSATYSDRPVLMMGGELVGWNQSLVLTRYGPQFRELRKHMNKSIGTRASMERFASLQEKETAKFLARVMADPGSLVHLIRKTTGAITLMMSYGYSVKEHDDPFLGVAEAAVSAFSECTKPGAYLVDMIPLLRYVPDWLPGAGWKAKAKRFANLLNDMADIPHQFVKDQMAAGTAVPSFTSELLDDGEVTPETEANIKRSASSLYAGGVDTIVSAIGSFYLAMMMYPEVQRKAQAEIDGVIEGDRFPALADQPNLPYADALVKEVFRWNPVGPLGVVHTATENDFYEGYFIPKGSSVIANIWEILHDPDTYADPLEFNPERFLGDRPEPDPRSTVFGYGRRICPGLEFAQSSTWVTCAMSLAVFNIEKYVDGFGNVVEPKIRYSGGMISQPPPFKCTIKPRSEKSAGLIASVEL